MAFRREIEAAGYPLRTTDRHIGGIVGTAVHKGVEVTLRGKMESGGTPAPLSQASEAAAGTVIAQMSDGPPVTFDANSPSRDFAIRSAIKMTAAYHSHVAPKIMPKIVETRLEAKHPLRPEILVSGQADTIAGTPQVLVAEQIGVRDTKTGTRRRANQAQLGTYVLLYRAHGGNPVSVKEDFIPRVRPEKPQPPPLTIDYDLELAIQSAAALLERIADAYLDFRLRVENGHRPPEWAFTANPASILCSAKFCPAHGTRWCREWIEQKDPQPVGKAAQIQNVSAFI